jgi:hypothetical protein
MRQQQNKDKTLCNLGKKWHGDTGNGRQAFGEECMRHTLVFEWHARIRADRKRWDSWRAKSRTRSSFFFTSRGLFIKNSSWWAKQSIPHTTVTFYGNCMKMCEDVAPTLAMAAASRQYTVSHSLFHQRIFDQKQHDCWPPPDLFFCVSQWNIKLRDHHFDTTEVIYAESQVVLNILTEHNFQDAF